MHRGRNVAWIFKTRRRQLHIGVGESNDWNGTASLMSDRHPRFLDNRVEAKHYRLIDGLVIIPRDECVLITLLLRRFAGGRPSPKFGRRLPAPNAESMCRRERWEAALIAIRAASAARQRTCRRRR